MTIAKRLARRLFRRSITRLDARNERGATAVEYAIMVALIGAVILGSVVFLGRSSSSTFKAAGAAMKTCGVPDGYGTPHQHSWDGTWWVYPLDGSPDEIQFTPC